MKDEQGYEMTEGRLIKEAMNCLASACDYLYHCECAEGVALAFMVNALFKYSGCILNGKDPLSEDDELVEEHVSKL